MTEDNIGQLFNNKFRNHRMETTPEDWMELELSLSKAGFFHFSFSSFNIYYAVILGAMFAFTVYLGIDKFILADKNSRNPVEEPVQKMYPPIIIHYTDSIERDKDTLILRIPEEAMQDYESARISDDKNKHPDSSGYDDTPGRKTDTLAEKDAYYLVPVLIKKINYSNKHLPDIRDVTRDTTQKEKPDDYPWEHKRVRH